MRKNLCKKREHCLKSFEIKIYHILPNVSKSIKEIR